MSPDPKQVARAYAAAIDECGSVRAATDLYADALWTYGADGVDWKTINGAILSRWAASTLERIKREAWKPVRKATGGQHDDRV